MHHDRKRSVILPEWTLVGGACEWPHWFVLFLGVTYSSGTQIYDDFVSYSYIFFYLFNISRTVIKLYNLNGLCDLCL